ncbi:hypothetical protein ASD31_17390 [Rhizobium sp. Root482]|nr:hypothetical protein ASD31_17390 [Rhizobium sp. Root482]
MGVEKPFKLVVLATFDIDDEGCLRPAVEPQQIETEERAVRLAKLLASKHAGVVVWSRTADSTLGEYGPPEVLFRSGEIPEMA